MPIRCECEQAHCFECDGLSEVQPLELPGWSRTACNKAATCYFQKAFKGSHSFKLLTIKIYELNCLRISRNTNSMYMKMTFFNSKSKRCDGITTARIRHEKTFFVHKIKTLNNLTW